MSWKFVMKNKTKKIKKLMILKTNLIKNFKKGCKAAKLPKMIFSFTTKRKKSLKKNCKQNNNFKEIYNLTMLVKNQNKKCL